GLDLKRSQAAGKSEAIPRKRAAALGCAGMGASWQSARRCETNVRRRPVTLIRPYATRTVMDPPRSRAAADHIARMAIRSILDAAAPLELSVEGTQVTVAIERLSADAVRLDCRWRGGHAALVMAAALGHGTGPTRHLVGVRIASAATNRALV